ncbi:MAG: PRC-barrel domain-containing protein [Patescibacteria group bacterium]
MRYSINQLQRLPVITVSGQELGRVVDVELDSQTHQIKKFVIRPRRSLAQLWGGQLLIAPSQVRSITADAMTVDDLITTQSATLPVMPQPAVPTPPLSVSE